MHTRVRETSKDKAAEPKRKSADPSSSSKDCLDFPSCALKVSIALSCAPCQDKGGPTQKSSPGQLQKSRRQTQREKMLKKCI